VAQWRWANSRRTCAAPRAEKERSISTRDLRVNERIRVREVRLIDENGEQLGVQPTPDALRIARERGLDLVEVAPMATPPVCRLMDYGRFKYEQTKKERDARKNSTKVELKEVRLRPKTDDHDIAFKTRNVQRFLEEGDKVKVTLLFRGREMAHPQIGRHILETVAEQVRSLGQVERMPLMEGRTMTMIISPLKSKVPSGGASSPPAAPATAVKPPTPGTPPAAPVVATAPPVAASAPAAAAAAPPAAAPAPATTPAPEPAPSS
jgi:translation initiation factor IF-3